MQLESQSRKQSQFNHNQEFENNRFKHAVINELNNSKIEIFYEVQN